MSVYNEKISLFVATPVHSNLNINYFVSCLNLQKECIYNGISISIQAIQSSLVTQGRQLLVSSFLDTDASHLLFIDSDISFEVKTVQKMLAADKDIILTPYPIKSFNSDKVKKMLEKTNVLDLKLLANQYTVNFLNPTKVKVENGIAEIEKGPAGFMLIKRQVFTKLIDKYPNFKINQHTLIDGKEVFKKNLYNFFDTFFSEKDNTYLGEDFYFCGLCREAGFKIYGLLDEYLVHHGDYGYKGRIIDDFYLMNNDIPADIKKP